MSDLVPFVASVLKERVAADLEEENKHLKEENDRLSRANAPNLKFLSERGRVEITGPGGAPVYAYGSLENAEVQGVARLRLRHLDLICADPTLCTITGMEDDEIRLSGILISTLREYDSSDNLTTQDEEYGNFYYLFRPSSHAVGSWGDISLDVVFGPLPDRTAEYIDTDEFSDNDIRDVKFNFITIDLISD